MVSKGFNVFGKMFCPLCFVGIVKISEIGIHGRFAVNGNASSAGKVDYHIRAASLNVNFLFLKINMFDHSCKLGDSAELFFAPFSALGVVFKSGVKKVGGAFKFAVLLLKAFNLFVKSAVSGSALLFKFFNFRAKLFKFTCYRGYDSADFVVCAFKENLVVVFGDVFGNACERIFKAYVRFFDPFPDVFVAFFGGGGFCGNNRKFFRKFFRLCGKFFVLSFRFVCAESFGFKNGFLYRKFSVFFGNFEKKFFVLSSVFVVFGKDVFLFRL